jgi:hypothetical protein
VSRTQLAYATEDPESPVDPGVNMGRVRHI